MNFSESLNVALWCGKEEAPGDRVGILRPDSGRRAGVVMVLGGFVCPTGGMYFTFRKGEGGWGWGWAEELGEQGVQGGRRAGSPVPHVVYRSESAQGRSTLLSHPCADKSKK